MSNGVLTSQVPCTTTVGIEVRKLARKSSPRMRLTGTPLSACYPPPSAIGEHLRLPDASDVREGVIGARIAAHSANTALQLQLQGLRPALSKRKRTFDFLHAPGGRGDGIHKFDQRIFHHPTQGNGPSSSIPIIKG